MHPCFDAEGRDFGDFIFALCPVALQAGDSQGSNRGTEGVALTAETAAWQHVCDLALLSLAEKKKKIYVQLSQCTESEHIPFKPLNARWWVCIPHMVQVL